MGSTLVLFLLLSLGSTWAQDAVTTRGLTISTAPLPRAFLHRDYGFRFVVHGGVSPYKWRIDEGTLPSGLSLLEDGRLEGAPSASGEFRFTITVTDGSRPAYQRSHEFVLKVVVPPEADWDQYPTVNGQRIEGSVKVSNQTEHDFDLTFIVLAVNDIGRATAIGYQHFTLPKDTLDYVIPFGETLAPANYDIYADVVGEVAETGSIFRSHLASTGKLRIVQGP